MKKSNTPEHTDTNGFGLTDDLLIEIFTKLPLKSVCRFKCLSKSWRRLIADSYVLTRLPLVLFVEFIRYGGNEDDVNRRYGCNSNGSFNETDLSYLPFYRDSCFIGSCNGLLLFHRIWSYESFYVCNPITKKWDAVPKLNKKNRFPILAFDGYKSPNYKVVSFGFQSRRRHVEVFSSETGRWVQHSLDWGVEFIILCDLTHYFNGVLYTMAYPGHVACFDLEKMCCSFMKWPEVEKDGVYLGNSGGFLQCAMNDENELRIWVLKGLEWVLKNRVNVAGISKWNGGCSHRVSYGYLHRRPFDFLAFHPKEEVIYLCVNKGEVVSYDLSSKKFALVCDLKTEKEAAYVFGLGIFPYSDKIFNCLV